MIILDFQPSDHQHVLAKFTYATPQEINEAIDVSLQARPKWERIPLK